jgi:hypothetical protein
MQVSWFNRKLKLAQTIWSGIQYSFLSEDNKQIGPFVFCKEFLLDACWATNNMRPIFTYGYEYNPFLDPKVCLTECRILLRNFYDTKFSNRVENMVKFLNHFEEKLDYSKSRFEICKDAGSPTIVLISDSKWMHAPPLLSLLTLLIRVGMIYNPKMDFLEHCDAVRKGHIFPYQYRDNEHLRRAWTAIKAILNKETNRFRFHNEKALNWPSGKINSFVIHEHSGIVSLATGTADMVCKDWYVKKENPTVRMA